MHGDNVNQMKPKPVYNLIQIASTILSVSVYSIRTYLDHEN